MNQIPIVLVAGISCFTIISVIVYFLQFLCNKCSKPNSRAYQLPLRRRVSTVSRADCSLSISTSFDPLLRQLSMVELSEATNNFDPKLIVGDGSFGLVYKAQLSNGAVVAVKKLSPDAFQGVREFRAEMQTLGKLRHPNIVNLLGYCVSGSDRVLIYELMEQGSLDEWLQGMSSAGCSWWVPLSWDLRVNIIKGVANGLAFLHGLDNVIVHRDIKASNVLLDNEFVAHIADFGLARMIEGAYSHVSTQAAGTMGYMPPEYLEGCMGATVKGDVYSFGVLMFEVASGKRPNWPIREEDHDIRMLEWAKKRVAQNKHVEVLDVNVPRKGLKGDEVYEFLKIADMCTNQKHSERPSMSHVVAMLDRVNIGS